MTRNKLSKIVHVIDFHILKKATATPPYVYMLKNLTNKYFFTKLVVVLPMYIITLYM